MIINRKKIKMTAAELLLLLCSVLYGIGIRYWFPVCQPSGDKVMSCHWAGQVLGALSVLLIALSAVHLFLPDEKLKAGMDLSMAGAAILTALVPGPIVSLCQSSEMSCRNGTVLWTSVFMILFCLTAAADIFLCRQSLVGSRHHRKTAGESV